MKNVSLTKHADDQRASEGANVSAEGVKLLKMQTQDGLKID